MERVIVTVKRQNEARVRDLEVPTDVESERLAEMIAQALHWESDPAGQPIKYAIMAEPPGRTLQPQESLADAGAWDGAWLVFQPLGDTLPEPPEPLPPPPPPPPIDTHGPVGGWRPLGIDLPTEVGPGQEEETGPEQPKGTGFVWKQVD